VTAALRVDAPCEGVVRVTLDRPARRNAYTTALCREPRGPDVNDSADAREGVTAFLERRPPVFEGR
jgi:enoyl-CoA hydratase/carnithine racemase